MKKPKLFLKFTREMRHGITSYIALHCRHLRNESGALRAQLKGITFRWGLHGRLPRGRIPQDTEYCHSQIPVPHLVVTKVIEMRVLVLVCFLKSIREDTDEFRWEVSGRDLDNAAYGSCKVQQALGGRARVSVSWAALQTPQKSIR